MTTALDIQGLQKTYSNGFTALKGIDLRVEQGDFFALLGANGAGKSTTIGIASSLVNKTAGKVSIFGYDLDTQREQAKAQIGLFHKNSTSIFSSQSSKSSSIKAATTASRGRKPLPVPKSCSSNSACGKKPATKPAPSPVA